MSTTQEAQVEDAYVRKKHHHKTNTGCATCVSVILQCLDHLRDGPAGSTRQRFVASACHASSNDREPCLLECILEVRE